MICIGLVNYEFALAKEEKVASQEELAAIYETVFGKKQESLPTELRSELGINGRNNGEITAQTDTQKIIQLERSVLLPKLKKYLKTKYYKQLEKVTQNKGWLTSNQLKEVGISLSYNIMTLSIDIDIKKKT